MTRKQLLFGVIWFFVMLLVAHGLAIFIPPIR